MLVIVKHGDSISILVGALFELMAQLCRCGHPIGIELQFDKSETTGQKRWRLRFVSFSRIDLGN